MEHVSTDSLSALKSIWAKVEPSKFTTRRVVWTCAFVSAIFACSLAHTRASKLASVFAIETVGARTPPINAAQDVEVPAPPGFTHSGTENLVFSEDGRVLREIEDVFVPGNPESRYIRSITYDASTGTIRHVQNLNSMRFLSATSDGRYVILATWDQQDRGFLVDVETGKTEPIPTSWGFSPGISGDGRLVGAFSIDDSDAENIREIVRLYDWRAKRLVAKQTSGTQGAGGIDGGGVTEDGKIEFSNNRSGMHVIDPKTGKVIVGFGPAAVRSPDGKWVIDMPYYGLVNPPEKGPIDIDIRNGTGRKVDTLLRLSVDDADKLWMGRNAFCGTAGRFIVANEHTLSIYEIPSGKRVAGFAVEGTPVFACNAAGTRIAIRSGERLKFQDLK
jgi:hypothetical protein